MFFDLPFDNEENIQSGDFVIATYLVSGISEEDALTRAGRFAIGQTVGTWVELPGITRAMVEGYQARVLSLENLSTSSTESITQLWSATMSPPRCASSCWTFRSRKPR